MNHLINLQLLGNSLAKKIVYLESSEDKSRGKKKKKKKKKKLNKN